MIRNLTPLGGGGSAAPSGPHYNLNIIRRRQREDSTMTGSVGTS
jgi:hypothetical protein